jgi:TetR/AcrR family transcriptional regulator, transcriptional repressor for nem operon
LTVSALHHFKIEPGLLDLGPRGGLSHTLDRRDGSIANGSHGKLAGSDGDTVQMYRARAALRDSTAELGARETEYVSENPQQWHVGGDIHILCFAVDQEIDHLVPPLPAALDNTTGRLGYSSNAARTLTLVRASCLGPASRREYEHAQFRKRVTWSAGLRGPGNDRRGKALARLNTRKAILEAALKLFIERGFNACSVQDICDEARVPKGSFYNHFKRKEALATEILAAYAKGTTDRSILTKPGMPALTRLKKHFAALNEYYSRCNDGCLVGKFMAEVSEHTPRIRERLLSVLNLWGGQLAATIAQAQAEGTVRKDLKADDLAAFLIDSYEGAILRMRVEKSPRALKSFVKIVFSRIVA